MTAPPGGATRLVPLTVEGPAGPLEALLQIREPDAPAFAAVICHPHPLYGGTLHNKVVHRAAATLFELGGAVLRFNFRGAGTSAGTHDRGAGELEDARAALGFMRARYPRAPLWLAGFSFGSWIAARLAAAERGIERLILIAPPVRRSDFQALRELGTPKLVVQGTADEVCPVADLEREWPTWAEPKQLILVEGAGHFFDRKLGPLAEALRGALAPAVRGTPA